LPRFKPVKSTRIFRQPSAVTAKMPASTALRSLGLLNAPSGTLSSPSVRIRLITGWPFPHPIFGPSSPAPQSQNPQHSASAMPPVLLTRRSQISPESGRANGQPVISRILRAPCIYRHLRCFATVLGEKCGFGFDYPGLI